tara:strand:- start:361 stop:2370 length:2010 start_codon:yes stop_codon:yes gene_type:complete
VLLRICIALFLAVPIPAFADEITEVETFEGGDGEQVTDIVVPPTENNNLVRVENTWQSYGGMDNYHMSLEHSKHGGTSNDYEFVLPTDHDVYEVAFTIGAMNNQGSVQYTHNDDTTQTNTIDAQSGMDINTMYEDVVYSVQDTANKFIDKFVITINDWSLLDNVEIKYDGTTTTTTTLDPLTIQRNANFASYGISETDEEKGTREEEEAKVLEQIIVMEIQEAIEVSDNMAETGYNETDEERAVREELTNVVIVVGDEEVTYTEKEQNDGTIDRDQERAINEELYGVALTDEQIERGDLELYDVEIIDEDIYEEEEQFIDDADILDIEYIELEDEEYIELIEEETKEIDLEIYEIELFQDDIIIDEVDWIEIRIENDLFPPTEEEIKEDLIEVQDKLHEEILRDELDREDEIQDKKVLDDSVQETIDEVVVREISEEQDLEPIELTEEEVAVEVAEIEEIIVIEIEIATEEEIEEFTEEELVEYEEAKEEAIQEYVQDLTNEEASEVLEEVNDIGVQNLDQASEEVQEIVQAVVEEAIADVEQLTTEQVEVVAEVLQVEAEDVQLIAESVKDDVIVAEAVEEYVERAVDNAEVENYTLADVVTEISYESFIENPIETFVDFNNLGDITIANIGDDMTNDQKEKAQEVVVPVILTRIATMAAFIYRRGNV